MVRSETGYLPLTLFSDLCLFEVDEGQIGHHYRTMHKLSYVDAIETIKISEKKHQWRKQNCFTNKRGECLHCRKIFKTLKLFRAHLIKCKSNNTVNNITNYFMPKCVEKRDVEVWDSNLNCYSSCLI